MPGSWPKAKAAALKVLGDKAKVPDFPQSVDKALDAHSTAYGAWNDAKQDVEDRLRDMQDANSAEENALKQYLAGIEKNDFDLDPKTDAKKIQQAQKILSDNIKLYIKANEKENKTFDELDKHLIQMSKYKPPP